MKYPEACYRIGNIFKEGVCVWADEKVKIKGRCHSMHKNEVTLEEISAETLAELGIENGEVMMWNMQPAIPFVNFYNIKDNDSLSIYQNKGELLGEFFLRVAKERNYIK